MGNHILLNMVTHLFLNKKEMDKDLKIYEYVFDPETMLGIELISLVENPAIEILAVQLSEQIPQFEIKLANEEQRLLVSPILIPDQLIYRQATKYMPEHYVKASKETIAELQEHYVKMGYQNNSNIEHKGKMIEGVTLIEQWKVKDSKLDTINSYGYENVPEGAWCGIMKLSQELWDDYVKTGKVKGFSVEGLLGIKQVEFAHENNENNKQIKLNKMNKTIDQIMFNAIKQIHKVALAEDLVEFKDIDGKSYFATELVIDAIVTDVDGNLIVDAEFVIDGNKYSTDENGSIKEIEPVEVAEVETELAEDVIKQVSKWEMKVINTTFELGDTVKYEYEGTEYSVGAGEYELSDGTTVVTDASGVIVEVKGKEAEDAVEADVTLADEVVEDIVSDVVVEDDVQALKDKIAEQEKTIADLEAENIQLKAKIAELQPEEAVELSKQRKPASAPIKDTPIALKSNGKETVFEMLRRLR